MRKWESSRDGGGKEDFSKSGQSSRQSYRRQRNRLVSIANCPSLPSSLFLTVFAPAPLRVHSKVPPPPHPPRVAEKNAHLIRREDVSRENVTVDVKIDETWKRKRAIIIVWNTAVSSPLSSLIDLRTKRGGIGLIRPVGRVYNLSRLKTFLKYISWWPTKWFEVAWSDCHWFHMFIILWILWPVGFATWQDCNQVHLSPYSGEILKSWMQKNSFRRRNPQQCNLSLSLSLSLSPSTHFVGA